MKAIIFSYVQAEFCGSLETFRRVDKFNVSSVEEARKMCLMLEGYECRTITQCIIK